MRTVHTPQNRLAPLVITLLALSLATARSFGQSLDINVSNINVNKGKVVVELYNSEASWLKKPFKKQELAPGQAVQTVSFQVPYGKYAVTIYQDINTNGEADMNFLGIPKEPVGFGNNYKPFGEPKFASALIEFSANAKPQTIKLYKPF